MTSEPIGTMSEAPDVEASRLAEDRSRLKNWKRWGPYLSERQWGTVREDYSPDGSCWDYFPHDHARSRAYRWGEDGLLGICDRECRLCFAVALWNGRDPILKERLFGLSNTEGNHGEDVKELYSYLESTPTHSYMKAIYRYPQDRFPYELLLKENRRRGLHEPEFELADTGIFEEGRYFDVYMEYAKNGPDDILINLSIHNRSHYPATLEVLPTLWFRNTWIWGCTHEGCTLKPKLELSGNGRIKATHGTLGEFTLYFETNDNPAPEPLFTENETNTHKLFKMGQYTDYVKDAFHEYIVNGVAGAVNPNKTGTKAALRYKMEIPGSAGVKLKFRLSSDHNLKNPFSNSFEELFALRKSESERFYRRRISTKLDDAEYRLAVLAYSGMLWNKQFYHLAVEDWMKGDPSMPPPPAGRSAVRNGDWKHLFCRDVLSMPDKWEYPWFAAWDLAFHCIPMAQIDPDFAKHQLSLFLREWYMHPNGQLPAYEFNYSDVNPPVHAWACWRVYQLEAERGHKDRAFLASTFQKLLINFTWWVNRKDEEGRHIFSGGFLGLDNIGVFDRSKPFPGGGRLEQADATAWMAFYAGVMLSIALELAQEDQAYEDMASKFFEHFISIADAMNNLGGTGLWDEPEGFYYDRLWREGRTMPLKIRSMVGLIPIMAVEVIHSFTLEKLEGFRKRLNWFRENRRDIASQISFMECNGCGATAKGHLLLAIPSRSRLEKVLRRLFDNDEFLSDFGFRSLSKKHALEPFCLELNGIRQTVTYASGESEVPLFGGNSNWRGPIWFPVNYLLAESLERYGHYYGDSFQMEFPTGSGELMPLGKIAQQIHKRLASLFKPNAIGACPYHGKDPHFSIDPYWRDITAFHEYFDADTGRGLGASQQTGWTALLASSLAHSVKALNSL